MNIDDSSKRKEKLEKLLKAKEKLNSINNYPTVTKEDLNLTSLEERMHEITSKDSLESRIDTLAPKSYEEASIKLKKIKDDTIEVVFIFDRSGSCSGTERRIINGFDSVIDHERKKSRNDIISTILFSEEKEIIHNRLNIDYVNSFDYTANGGTSLYDTLVEELERIDNSQKKDLFKPKDTIVFIMTDGEDTTSKRYFHYDAKKVIKEKINSGWKFIFLGVNINVDKEAEKLGIPSSNATEYNPSRLEDNFQAMKLALEDVHETGDVSKDWSKPIKDNLRLDSPKTYTKKLLEDNNAK